MALLRNRKHTKHFYVYPSRFNTASIKIALFYFADSDTCLSNLYCIFCFVTFRKASIQIQIQFKTKYLLLSRFHIFLTTERILQYHIPSQARVCTCFFSFIHKQRQIDFSALKSAPKNKVRHDVTFYNYENKLC